MLGFGLLGSASTSFIRHRLKDSRNYDLIAITVRGVSAAVVIFLGAQGGIAIFAADVATLNPYILFLTCLVGAVFSEDVWNIARNRIQRHAQSEKSETGNGGDRLD